MSDTAETTQVMKLYIVNQTFEVIPVIQYEEGDELIHTDEHPNCEDNTCPCNAHTVEGSLTDPLSIYREEARR